MTWKVNNAHDHDPYVFNEAMTPERHDVKLIKRLPSLLFIGKRITCLYCFNRLSNMSKAPSLYKARFFNHDSAIYCMSASVFASTKTSFVWRVTALSTFFQMKQAAFRQFFSWIPEYGVMHYRNALRAFFLFCVLMWASI